MQTHSKVAYFVLKQHRIIDKHNAMLSMDDGCSILSNLKVFVYPNIIPVNRRIVCAEFPPYMFNALVEYCQDHGVEKPFSTEGRAILQIGNSYIGRTLQDVFDRFPALAGYVLDGDGETTNQFKMPRIRWAFDD